MTAGPAQDLYGEIVLVDASGQVPAADAQGPRILRVTGDPNSLGLVRKPGSLALDTEGKTWQAQPPTGAVWLQVGAGGGDVVGPETSELGHIATWGNTAGTLLRSSVVTLGEILELILVSNTVQEKQALQGTDGTPDSSNRYVTNSDARNSDPREPIGAAGGNLALTFPNPSVVGMTDGDGTSFPVYGPFVDGEVLGFVGGYLRSVAGGGAANLSTTLGIGLYSGPTDIAMQTSAYGVGIRGEDYAATPGAPGGTLLIRGGLGGIATAAFEDFTINATVTTPTVIRLGFPPFAGANLTGVVGPRTPGSDDFSVDPATPAALAAEIAAAINDPTNSVDTAITATVLTAPDRVRVTRNFTGAAGNTYPASVTTVTPGGAITDSGAGTLTGGADGGLSGAIFVGAGSGGYYNYASVPGDARGGHAVDLQGMRTYANRVASGDFSFIFPGVNNRAAVPHTPVGGVNNRVSEGPSPFNDQGTLFVHGRQHEIYSYYGMATSQYFGAYHYNNFGGGSGTYGYGNATFGNSHFNFATSKYKYSLLNTGTANQSYGAYQGQGWGIWSGLFNRPLYGYQEGIVLGGRNNVMGAYGYGISHTAIFGSSNFVGTRSSISDSIIAGRNNVIGNYAGTVVDVALFGRQGFAKITGSLVQGDVGAFEGKTEWVGLIADGTGPTTMFSRRTVSGGGSGATRIALDDDMSYHMTANIVAVNLANGDSAFWTINALVRVVAGVITIVGSTGTGVASIADAGAAAWSIAATTRWKGSLCMVSTGANPI
jgi:hypothetical protein